MLFVALSYINGFVPFLPEITAVLVPFNIILLVAGFVMLIKRLISLLNSENSPNHIMKVKEGIFVCENTVVLDQEIQKV